MKLSDKIAQQFDRFSHLITKHSGGILSTSALVAINLTGAAVAAGAAIEMGASNTISLLAGAGGILAALPLAGTTMHFIDNFIHERKIKPITSDLNKVSNSRLLTNYSNILNACNQKLVDDLVSNFHAIADTERMQDFVKYLGTKPEFSDGHQVLKKLTEPSAKAQALARKLNDTLPIDATPNRFSNAIRASFFNLYDNLCHAEKKLPTGVTAFNHFANANNAPVTQPINNENAISTEQQLQAIVQLRQSEIKGYPLPTYIEQFKGSVSAEVFNDFTKAIDDITKPAVSMELAQSSVLDSKETSAYKPLTP